MTGPTMALASSSTSQGLDEEPSSHVDPGLSQPPPRGIPAACTNGDDRRSRWTGQGSVG